jgi:hypothetical protein
MVDMDMRKFALEQQDFFTRLKGLQETRVTPKNLPEVVISINAFNKEKDETVAVPFGRGVEAKKGFDATWARFVKSNGGEWAMAEFLPMKGFAEIIYMSLQEVYVSELQSRSYGDEALIKVVSALNNEYENPDGLLEDDRKEIMAIAQQMVKINEAISRMAKRYAEKLRDGTAQIK